MRAVLLSVKPKWCELIASGIKKLELRKTKPRIETPFKCYIYETKATKSSKYFNTFHKNTSGKIIGEFVCDAIIPISITYSDMNSNISMREFPGTSMTDREIIAYLGNGVKGYCWHISNLIIYDEPKELSEFEIKKDCGGYFKWHKLSRPPQSWCYVEELKEREEM